MIEAEVPGFGVLRLRHAMLDFNGTLALDGRLREGVRERLRALSAHLEVHVVTADTNGTAAAELAGLPIELHVVAATGQARAKTEILQRLGADTVAAIGNGRNDRDMLMHAALSIAMCGGEGCATEALRNAQILCVRIEDALDLLCAPNRLIATLRD